VVSQEQSRAGDDPSTLDLKWLPFPVDPGQLPFASLVDSYTLALASGFDSFV